MKATVSRNGEVAPSAVENRNPSSQPSATPDPARERSNPRTVCRVDAGVPPNYEDDQQSDPPLPSPPYRIERPHKDFWTQSNGIQPADVLSRRATSGMFSLQNILSTQHTDTSQRTSQDFDEDDPIDKGLVNLHVATSLFDGFMKHLNPFVSQLDPYLHTLHYVRQKSTFLFVVVLAAASKLLHSSLFPSLYSHAETLLLATFRRGSKSAEIIQAILILTYWKKPDDSRAWLSVGYAIRMAFELDWHHLGSDKMKPPSDVPHLQAREHRNIERSWLLLFVYDRRYARNHVKQSCTSTDLWAASAFRQESLG